MHGERLSNCLICKGQLEPSSQSLGFHHINLRRAFCECFSIDTAEVPLTVGSESFCCRCKYRLKEWVDLQNVIADLNLRAKRIQATLTCLALTSSVQTSFQNRNFQSRRNRHEERIKRMISKRYDVRVHLKKLPTDCSLESEASRVEPNRHFSDAISKPRNNEQYSEPVQQHDWSMLDISQRSSYKDFVNSNENENGQLGEEHVQVGKCAFDMHDNMYVCSVCSKKFQGFLTKCHLKEHVKVEHPDLLPMKSLNRPSNPIKRIGPTEYIYRGKFPFEFKDGKYFCGLCPQTSASSVSLIYARKNLMTHIRIKHEGSASRQAPKPDYASSTAWIQDGTGNGVRRRGPINRSYEQVGPGKFIYRGKISFAVAGDRIICGLCSYSLGGKLTFARKNMFTHFRKQHQDVLVDTSLITADGDHETSDVDLSSGGNSPNYDPLSPTGTGVEIKLECPDIDDTSQDMPTGPVFNKSEIPPYAAQNTTLVTAAIPNFMVSDSSGTNVPGFSFNSNDDLSVYTAPISHPHFMCDVCGFTFSGPGSESRYIGHVTHAHS